MSDRHGGTPMERQFGGRWSREQCTPGDVSRLARSEQSHWHWTRDIDVVHVYLEPELLSRASARFHSPPHAYVIERRIERAKGCCSPARCRSSRSPRLADSPIRRT
nr:hypothetical protein [Panacagrimonas sp.]